MPRYRPSNSSAGVHEHIFPPVVSVSPFRSDEDAIPLANDTSFGLANYVHTTNLARAHTAARALQSGTAHRLRLACATSLVLVQH
ncbi:MULTISPECIES: aldehyde dehydrogenase family protein [unclassified Mycobacterium]|uniref:aldehyde dehydrogenase family protein n=1 Tax=unclassified Mycobacterium TaxID=2642494 RepID=UPI0009EE4C09|nr:MULTISPECIES: aldehyde dehydrogenase family protein [unclassified Mycobacterium]